MVMPYPVSAIAPEYKFSATTTPRRTIVDLPVLRAATVSAQCLRFPSVFWVCLSFAIQRSDGITILGGLSQPLTNLPNFRWLMHRAVRTSTVPSYIWVHTWCEHVRDARTIESSSQTGPKKEGNLHKDNLQLRSSVTVVSSPLMLPRLDPI